MIISPILLGRREVPLPRSRLINALQTRIVLHGIDLFLCSVLGLGSIRGSLLDTSSQIKGDEVSRSL
jgi:hypothetical protein